MIYRLYKLDFLAAKESIESGILYAAYKLYILYESMLMHSLDYRLQFANKNAMSENTIEHYEIISLTRIFESHFDFYFDIISVNSWTSAFITVLYQHQIIL